ncbi:sensor histidine kinase [Blastococcus haudaquaticus]|uniref:Anti-sigma regulatory factor (Ser/Thr protein kinase) n=1 Tax=Blastococcus haudaquaticus TaxID=1938745 RepID=A0A286GJQ5_9ACTN|nr:sensor histidine kinase [Blastococcus haudaquaticus]SOD95763.1 Anti-sigma regulatory factor (Ser/Thr protein kinase) [Blastococcus haudaquaticus]
MSHGHAGAVVGSEAELLAVALPFIDAGLRDGDLVALACPADTVEVLSRALGTRAAVVESEPRLNLLGSRAPDALGMCARFLERARGTGSGRFRVLSEVDFGSDPADWREGQRFEAVTNRILGSAPMDIVCIYDRRRLDPSVVESAAATHPLLMGPAGRSVPNPAYQDPATYVPALPMPREPAEDGEPVLAVDDAPTLAGLRRRLGATLASLVPDRDQAEDLHLAAAEIASNAFRHGSRPVSARVWAAGDRIVCVIADRGTSYGDPFSGFTPAHGLDLSAGGMGLWLARKLWDHVDVLPGPAGLSVRLSTRIR